MTYRTADWGRCHLTLYLGNWTDGEDECADDIYIVPTLSVRFGKRYILARLSWLTARLTFFTKKKQQPSKGF